MIFSSILINVLGVYKVNYNIFFKFDIFSLLVLLGSISLISVSGVNFSLVIVVVGVVNGLFSLISGSNDF